MSDESRLEEIEKEVGRLMQVLLGLDVGGDEWMRVAEERRILLLERIRLKPELKVLLREEFHPLVDS